MSCLWLIDPEHQLVFADYAREKPEKPGIETDISDSAGSNAGDSRPRKPEEEKSPISYNTEIFTFDEMIPVRTGLHSCDIDFSKIRDRISWFFP